MSTFTKEQLPDDRLVKILTETQAVVTDHNSRCVRGSVEVDARLFESMLVEIQLRRHLMEQQAAMLQGSDEKPELTVWYGSMPESNGKSNWTAILHRKGEGRCMDGFTIDRSEYPGRVLYAADRVRYLIGEKSERPSILDYDADAHSGYVKPGNSSVIPDGWVACSERMPEREIDVQVYCSDKNEQMVGYMERNERDGYFRFASLPNGGGVYCQPTHWMPLQAAPQQEAP